MKRFLWLGWALFLFLICSGCGDTFRPIIIPNPVTFPDPRAAHTVVAINDNGTAYGSALVVDVSGDSEVSIAGGDCTNPQQLCAGVAPVHAVQQTANQVLVVSQGSATTGSALLSKLVFSGTSISNTRIISLPPSSAPNFVATTESNTAYVLLPNYQPNFPNGSIVPSLGVVTTLSNSLVDIKAVGNNPVAMAETPDGKKLYVANQGSSSVSGFNTVDRSSRAITGSFNAPLWVVARSDSQRVYVLNGDANGTLSTIDTTSTAGPDTVIDASISVPGATHMLYDGHLNRLYIPGGGQVTILDVSQSTPHILGNPISIPTALPSTRSAQDPCSITTAVPLTAVAVAALPDGSRAYVGAFYEDASGNICPQFTVINTSGNTVKSTAAIPGFPNYDAFCASTRFRFTMAAGGDSSRVYLASCDQGAVNIIDTSNDTYITNLPAPGSARPPIPPSTQPPPQNPVFLIAGP